MSKKRKVLSLIMFFLITTTVVFVFVYPKNSNDTSEEENLSLERNNENQNIQSTNSDETAGTQAENFENLLLPDIRVEPLSDIAIETNQAGRKLLRFPGTFVNIGDGPLELIGEENPESNTTEATQIIYKKEGAKDERVVGNFVIHPGHNHWHFENFVEFALYSYKEDGSLDEKLATTDKMTFCIHDFAPSSENLPGKPERQVYPQCISEVQGISVGWSDTYQSHVSGQELDITDIPDGSYAFYATVDPENRILEKNKNNNSTTSYIEISGNTARILTEP